MITTTKLITSTLNENVTFKADDETIGFVSKTYHVKNEATGVFSIFPGSVAEIRLDRQAEDRLLSTLLARKAARESTTNQ